MDIHYYMSVLGLGIGVGFGLYCFFSLIGYSIWQLFKLFKI